MIFYFAGGFNTRQRLSFMLRRKVSILESYADILGFLEKPRAFGAGKNFKAYLKKRRKGHGRKRE